MKEDFKKRIEATVKRNKLISKGFSKAITKKDDNKKNSVKK